MLVTAIAFGLLIGATLGLLGGGGSILTVPIFVYVLGFGPKEAIAMSLAVVGVASAAGVATHWRAGSVNVRVGLVFGAFAMLGTHAGTRIAGFLTGAAQLALFGVVMVTAAAFMASTPRDEAAPGVPARTQAAGVGLLVTGALVVGLLTGLVGVGGGFLIVPALVLLALPIRAAVSTSLLIIALNCVVGLYGYVGRVDISWTAVALVTAGTVPGIAAGAYFHRLVPPVALRRGFATFLILIAAFILYQNVGPVLSAFSR